MPDLINQKTNDQCVIASVAMATGLDYDYVLNVASISGAYTSSSGTHASSILNHLDVCYKNVYDHNHRISNSFWREMLFGRRAILSVKSVNNEGGTHSIFWDGFKILDPQNGNTFDDIEKKFFTEISDDMVIDSANLICECGCSTDMKPKWKVEKLES
jgi:hypothetical protein